LGHTVSHHKCLLRRSSVETYFHEVTLYCFHCSVLRQRVRQLTMPGSFPELVLTRVRASLAHASKMLFSIPPCRLNHWMVETYPIYICSLIQIYLSRNFKICLIKILQNFPYSDHGVSCVHNTVIWKSTSF
jgi:hypothetical protein